LLIGVALFALTGLGMAIGFTAGPPLDLETGCRTDRPPAAHTLVLVDATDRLSPRHKRRLQAVVEEERARLNRYDRITILLLDADDPRELRRLFSACDPGDGRSVNPLVANPREAQERWDQGFAAPLNAALAQVNGGGEQSWSPIVEALATAATDPDFGPNIAQRRIVLATDLLEHHPQGYSLFREGVTYDDWRASAEARAVRLDLTSIAVRIVTQDRPERAERQRAARAVLWEPLLEDAGAESVSFDPTP
jgi:hypothetical protein